MSDSPNIDLSWAEYSRELKRKSKDIIHPIVANLELTPRCNFCCKMCYVHLTEKEAKSIGREHTAAEWIDMGRQMLSAGTLEILLTGGEVFLRPDFREIYEAFSEMGFLLYIYSNGYLIDEQTVKWLSKRPPMRLRITLYGASNETYEKVTGVKGAFDRVLQNIDNILVTNIPLSLAATLISDNIGDERQMDNIAAERNLKIVKTSGVMKPVRGARSDSENVRMNIGQMIRENPLAEKVEVFGLSPDPFAVCSSNGCGYWITWDGKMTICSFIEKPCTHPFEGDFKTAWDKLQEMLKEVKKPAECGDCRYARFCIACPGLFASETGFTDQTNGYICETAKARYDAYLKNKLNL